MAVTIVFLIMTAVWTQRGRLQVMQQGSGPVEDPTVDGALPPVVLSLSATRWTLTVGGTVVEASPLVRTEMGVLDLAKLKTQLDAVKKQWPEQSAVTLHAEDAVPYDDLVSVIDACLGAAFPGVAVSPAS